MILPKKQNRLQIARSQVSGCVPSRRYVFTPSPCSGSPFVFRIAITGLERPLRRTKLEMELGFAVKHDTFHTPLTSRLYLAFLFIQLWIQLLVVSCCLVWLPIYPRSLRNVFIHYDESFAVFSVVIFGMWMANYRG